MLVKLVALLALVGVAVAASDVIELHDSDFDTKIRQHDIALVEFYAPWCGHCKRLAPEYEKAATALKNADPPVALVKVDCTAETKVCGKQGVSGYPTLKIFKNGEAAADYNGPREADGIVKYMRSKAGPTSTEINSVPAMEKFLANKEHSIVGFFAKHDSAAAAEFRKTADRLSEDYRFAHSSNADVLAHFKHTDEVVIYQPPRLQVKLLPAEAVLSGTIDTAKLVRFIESDLHGLVGHRTSDNAKSFASGPSVTVFYNVDYVKDVKGTNYVRNRVIKVAQKLQSEGLKVRFSISNLEEFKQELTEFGVEDAAADAKVVLGRGANGEKYKLEGEYSVDALEKFARDLLDRKLEQYLKSEPVPASNSEPVKVVVAKQFDEIVNDESRDVLIEFYAPWCGHCKTLAPKYDELAAKLKGESGITIAKMDATANDVPGNYDVKGFPTIYFAPKGSKSSPRKYEGGREVEDFIKYLAREATEPLKGWDRSGKKVKAKTDL